MNYIKRDKLIEKFIHGIINQYKKIIDYNSVNSVSDIKTKDIIRKSLIIGCKYGINTTLKSIKIKDIINNDLDLNDNLKYFTYICSKCGNIIYINSKTKEESLFKLKKLGWIIENNNIKLV